jgi:hypothetical protein
LPKKNQRLLPNPRGSYAFCEILVIRFAYLRGRFVIEEWQEGIAPTASRFSNRMQQRARKHNRTPGRRPEGTRPVFGKAQFAALEVIIEIGRDCKVPVRGALGGVVPVRSGPYAGRNAE